MKNLKQIRFILSGALLASTLILMSGCGGCVGGQSTCPTCGPSSGMEGVASADVLLSLSGKPVISKERLDDFYEVYLRSRKEGAFAAMDPYAKRNAFNELVTMEVLKNIIKRDGLDQDPEYKKNFERAYNLALYTVNAEILGNRVLESIDVSDDAVEKFYKDNLGKNPAFDSPPFLKTPEGIRMRIVQFRDEKSAENFLEKAKKAGADFAALARAIAKDVRGLGIVTAQTTFPQDLQKSLKGGVYALKGKAKTLQANDVELVSVPGGPFVVVRGVGPRQTATYAELAEVVKEQPDLQEKLANYKKQTYPY